MPGGDQDVAVFGAAVLLHHDRIRARGHRRPGKDADCLAAVGGPPEGMPGGRAAGHRQPGFAIRIEAVEMNRVAVDGRVGERRHRVLGDHVRGQNPPQRRAQRHRFRVADDPDTFIEQGQRPLHRHQFAAAGKTIIGELRHRPALFQPAMGDHKIRDAGNVIEVENRDIKVKVRQRIIAGHGHDPPVVEA